MYRLNRLTIDVSYIFNFVDFILTEPEITLTSQRFTTQEIMEMSAINELSTEPRGITAARHSHDHRPAAEGQVTNEVVSDGRSVHGPYYNDVDLWEEGTY